MTTTSDYTTESKGQNIMTKKLQPKLRFRGFTDAWEQRKLGSLGTSYSGLSGKNKTDFGHGSGSYITYLNVFQNPIADIDGTDRIEIDTKQNTVRYGDVLFTVSSETPEEVGMSSVWLGNQQNVYLNSFCFGYRQNGAFDAKYLAYMLRSKSIRNRMKVLAQGISRFNISQRRVMDIEVSFPSMDEQQKIGTLCGKLDQLIAAEKRKLSLLEEKKTALVQRFFDQKIRFKGCNSSWKRYKFANVFRFLRTNNYSRDYLEKSDTGIVDIHYGDILINYNCCLSIGDHMLPTLRNPMLAVPYEKDRLMNGDVVIADTAEDRTAGRCIELFDVGNREVLGGLHTFAIRSVIDFGVGYLGYYLNSFAYRKQLISRMQGTKVISISRNSLEDTIIAAPQLDEQKAIGDLLRKFDATAASTQQKIDLLNLKKRALLQQMFV